ncbi:probable Ras GTPase-activating protein isoform X3 [Varroa destructor]|uniref:Ras GTPase-activating protein n=1 Tax=Varroa destructor TaxID=109461 RepID=A0A7M7KVQ1_VARDE|nr:probable Ras GTPase-activating protein isoform X3 [Varroa destructor]
MTPGVVPIDDLKSNTTKVTTASKTATVAASTTMNSHDNNNHSSGNSSVTANSNSNNNNSNSNEQLGGNARATEPVLPVIQEKFRVEGWLFVKDKDLVYSARSGSPVVDSRFRRVSRRGASLGGDLQKSSSGVINSTGSLRPSGGFSTLSNRDVTSNGWNRYYCALHRGIFSHYSSEEQSLISDKVAIDFERVRLDGGPLRVYNPWYDKGTLTGDTTCLLEGASLVTPVPEEDEGCESEVSLESTITKDLRDREPTSTKIQSVTATATSGRENFHVQTNGQTVTIRRRAPSNKVDRATSPSVSAHPMAGSTDHTSYDKALESRRSSAPSTPVLGVRPPPVSSSLLSDDAASTAASDTNSTSRFSSFFSKKSFKNNPLKRTKSVTKLERKRTSTLLRDQGGAHGGVLRNSRSHESLLASIQGSVAPVPNVDLCLHPSAPAQSATLAHTPKGLHHTTSGSHHHTPTPLAHQKLLLQQQQHSQLHNSSATHGGHGVQSQAPGLGHMTTVVHAVDPSLLKGEHHKHCFELGSRLYSCSTREERDKWVRYLVNARMPGEQRLDASGEMRSKPRTENFLQVTVFEAKGIPNKKKYLAELNIGSKLRAETCPKQKLDMCFWGENFEFDHLPLVKETLTVSLYREVDKRKKRHLLGSVKIPLKATTNTTPTHVESWYQLEPNNATMGSNPPPMAIRVRTKFQSLEVFPMDCYADFFGYLQSEYPTLCELLEPSVSVKTKEEVATALVHIMQKQGLATEFVTELVMNDVQKIEDEQLTFRGNSVATKTMEAYMKLMGGQFYLQETLRGAIELLLAASDDCEVDPSKVANHQTLLQHQLTLKKHVDLVWRRIRSSAAYFPAELRLVFGILRDRLRRRQELYYNLLSASIFLRFLCPAILSPSLFKLCQEYPGERVSRNLTLIAKTIQTLANFAQFGGKEHYMEFMNDFIHVEMQNMREFLAEISSGPPVASTRGLLSDDSLIDCPRHLAQLHVLLKDAFPAVSKSQATKTNVDKLMQALNSVQYPKPPKTAPQAAPGGHVHGALAARDLSTCDDYVLLSALGAHGGKQTSTPISYATHPTALFSNGFTDNNNCSGVSSCDASTSSCEDTDLEITSTITSSSTQNKDVATSTGTALSPMSAIRDQGVGEAFFDHECHLKEILADLHEKLSQAEMKLEAQKRRAEEGEERLRRQKEEKDEQMKSIITRLITVEDELRKEKHEMQREMAQVIAAKQQMIDERESKILNLDATNQRLLSALSQLREKYDTSLSPGSSASTAGTSNGSIQTSGGSPNGNQLSGGGSPIRAAQLIETAVQTASQYKSSSC